MKEKGFSNRYMKFLSFLVLISKTSVQYFTSKDSNEIKGDILGSFESSTFTKLYVLVLERYQTFLSPFFTLLIYLF